MSIKKPVNTGINTKWSESHTSYELYSLSINIIYELLLIFNGSIAIFAYFWYNV